jgi:hypothetical protein
MFFCWFLPFLYTTSYTISYTTSYVKYTISYVKNTISYTIHTISYTISYKMYDIVCFWGGSCHFYIRRRIRRRIKKYDVVYDMQLLVAILRYRTYISYASSLYYVIVRQNRKKNTIWQYDVACDFPIVLPYDVACDFFHVPGLAFAAGRTGHAPGAPRPTGPASWSSALPDGLYCIVIVLSLSLACTTANVSGDSLVRAKMGISSWNLVASRVTRWHRGAKWLNGRVDGLLATQVARGPVAPPVAANWASDCW